MTLHWPDEDIGLPGRHRSEMDRFLSGYRDLPDRLDAGRRLNASTARHRDPEAEASILEAGHPVVAARIRVEADEPYLRTSDGLRAEAALVDAAELPPVEAVERLGLASGDPIGERLIEDALAEDMLRDRLVEGLRAAFAASPVFQGDKKGGEPSSIVEEARKAIDQSRATWSNPAGRNLHDLRRTLQWASHVSLVPLAHRLMAPLSRAAPAAAIALLDEMPSPLDAVLCLEQVHLDVERFEPWAHAVCHAPPAWDETGWTGAKGFPNGLALPLLLWRAEERLRRMTAEAAPDRAGPDDVAAIVRERDNGAVTAWHWCAGLLSEADRRERDGRIGSEGLWLTVQALAAGGGWSGFDPGRGRDVLNLEAALRAASESPDMPSHISSLLPRTPEEFLDRSQGADLSWVAFSLVGGFGPMFEGRPPYGLATRILSTAFCGVNGSERLRTLWHDALAIRELAAGGVTMDADRETADRRDPADPLHLIVALGLAAVEMSGRGGGGDLPRLLAEVDAMLAEIRHWDWFGHDALLNWRKALPGDQAASAE